VFIETTQIRQHSPLGRGGGGPLKARVERIENVCSPLSRGRSQLDQRDPEVVGVLPRPGGGGPEKQVLDEVK
jgi:hypothetical protein